MKFNSIQPMGPQAPMSPAGGTEKPREGGDSFDQVLNRATQGQTGAAALPPTQATGAASAVAPLGEIRATAPVIAAQGPSPTAEGTVDLLSMLEDYALMMESGEVPLKEIDSLVGEMDALAEKLAASLGDEPDPRIRELAEQSATLAGIESVKFRRGDYL